MSGIKVADMATAQWERLIRTDLTGCFFTCRRFVKDLRAAGRPGSIVNVSSIHSGVMRAGGADYDAAKGGLRNLPRTLALETARPIGRASGRERVGTYVSISVGAVSIKKQKQRKENT